jgi:hypothetical protein
LAVAGTQPETTYRRKPGNRYHKHRECRAKIVYQEVIETVGDFRVVIEVEEGPEEPYDDGQSPLLRLGYRAFGWRAEHVMKGSRPADDDARIEEAAIRWGAGGQSGTHGATKVEWYRNSDYAYLAYDSAAWREWTGASEGSADLSEYRSWCEGEVFGYIVQQRVNWHADNPLFPDQDRWEDVPDESCWGLYGIGYAREAAIEALEGVIVADADKQNDGVPISSRDREENKS